MGCGSSAPVNGEATMADDGTQTDRKTQNELAVKKSSKNKVIPLDSNSNREDLNSSNPVPKSVAFEVPLGPDKDKAALFLAKPPPRLQRLEPLTLPKLTPEMLAEKQKLADEKRLLQLKKKASSSSKSSRRRKELMKAKQFEREQTSEIIHLKDEQMKSAEEKRVARLREIQEKQKLREERAKRAREKAKRLKEAGDDLEIDVEKDEDYNNSDADSWPGEENKIERKDQRAESGYSSPHKQQRNPREHPMSASTVDSFDTAFTRQPSKALQIAQDTDNFFDS